MRKLCVTSGSLFKMSFPEKTEMILKIFPENKQKLSEKSH
jgi:hypothetical protein